MGEKEEVILCAEGASRFKEKTEGQGGGYACGKYAARQNSERRLAAFGGSAGALPRTPFRELFEKSSLKTLKNFWERRSKLFCAQRAQDGWRGESRRRGERVSARITGGAAGSGIAADAGERVSAKAGG